MGKNDKSKVVAKLQKKGAGAPVREPVVSEDEQKAMIAFYHKKEQEMQRMTLEDEDAYQNSTWADPKALKKAFSGAGDISWRAGRWETVARSAGFRFLHYYKQYGPYYVRWGDPCLGPCYVSPDTALPVRESAAFFRIQGTAQDVVDPGRH